MNDYAENRKWFTGADKSPEKVSTPSSPGKQSRASSSLAALCNRRCSGLDVEASFDCGGDESLARILASALALDDIGADQQRLV